MPMSRRCTGMWVTSSPPTVMRPPSGSSKPAIMRSVVVLPQPDGPSSAKNSPGATVRSMRSTTRVLPSKLFSTRSRRTSAATRAVGTLTHRDGTCNSASATQKPRHARVDVVLALVVPFPVDLDQLRDLRLGVVELGVVFRVELHLLVRGRIPDRLARAASALSGLRM